MLVVTLGVPAQFFFRDGDGDGDSDRLLGLQPG
jgi:hypothetical protein